MRDPLQLLTWLVGLGLVVVLGRYAVTGQPIDDKVLTSLGTILGALIAALSTRKPHDDDPPPPPPTQSPPPSAPAQPESAAPRQDGEP